MMESLPEVLSGEQVRCVLHVSKRKCAWMLNNGFIKCQNTGKRTRKYTVLKKDLLKYIEDSQKHPEHYVTPYAEFSTAKYINKNRRQYLRKAGFPSSLPDGFRAWLENELEPIPDALTIPQVIATTGYTDNSVDRWLRQGHLKFVQTQTTKVIAKDWLIDFYCGYGYTIAQMSDQHIELMVRYFNKKIISKTIDQRDNSIPLVYSHLKNREI